MIYSQTFFNLASSWLLFFWIFFRLVVFLKKNVDRNFAFLIAFATFMHPLSLDALLGPNLFFGLIPFYFLIEALIFHEKKSLFLSFLMILVSSFFNISHLGICLVFLVINRNVFNKFKAPIFVFVLLSLIFLYKNLLPHFYHLYSFPAYFFQNILFPTFTTLSNYGLYAFPTYSFLTCLVLIIYIEFKCKGQFIFQRHLLVLFLPIMGVFFSNWNEGYRVWNDYFFRPSDFIAVTFVFIYYLASRIPRKIFLAYFVCLILASISWGSLWFPISNVLTISAGDLPEKFIDDKKVKMLLRDQYILEKNFKASREIDQTLEELISK